MREIKFRPIMYSKSLDKYFIGDGLSVDSGLSCLFGFENEGLEKLDNIVLCSKKFINEISEKWWERDWVHIGILQYTGLKDKNGVEIYEGDIVTILDCEPSIYQIKWVNHSSRFRIFTINPKCNQFESADFDDEVESDELEVIGNIYENPELLK